MNIKSVLRYIHLLIHFIRQLSWFYGWSVFFKTSNNDQSAKKKQISILTWTCFYRSLLDVDTFSKSDPGMLAMLYSVCSIFLFQYFSFPIIIWQLLPPVKFARMVSSLPPEIDQIYICFALVNSIVLWVKKKNYTWIILKTRLAGSMLCSNS